MITFFHETTLLLMTLERRHDPPLGGLDSVSGPKCSNSFQAAGFVESRTILFTNSLKRIMHALRAAIGMCSISRVHEG